MPLAVVDGLCVRADRLSLSIFLRVLLSLLLAVAMIALMGFSPARQAWLINAWSLQYAHRAFSPAAKRSCGSRKCRVTQRKSCVIPYGDKPAFFNPPGR